MDSRHKRMKISRNVSKTFFSQLTVRKRLPRTFFRCLVGSLKGVPKSPDFQKRSRHGNSEVSNYGLINNAVSGPYHQDLPVASGMSFKHTYLSE